MGEDVCAAVLAAERRRCAAMIANDPDELGDVLDERLRFHHATGAVDDRAAFLAKMATGRIQYTGLAWDEDEVTPLGPGVAMLTGRMATDVRVGGVDKRLNNRVITVWCETGGTWRMAAFQSTPLAA